MAASAESLVREAVALQRANRYPEAVAAYERLLQRFPRLSDCWFNLGVLQRRLRNFPAARAAYGQALATGAARPEEAHLQLGLVYSEGYGDRAAAERELELALRVNPAYIPALLNLGNLHEDLGRRVPAREVYERILALDAFCFEALARLANLAPATGRDAMLIARLEAALAASEPTAAERASLGFALGRLYDAAGDYAAAFTAYAAAKAASRASAPHVPRYDRAWQHAFVDRLIAAPPAARSAAGGGPRPIFICGMLRSGSTLIEQLLATCPGVAAAGELEFLPRLVAGELAPFPESLATLSPARLEAIAAAYQAELARYAPGARWVIDKRPDNFLCIGLIKRLFPDARIVHTTRNPLDNCLSVYFLHVTQQLSYAFNLMDIGHYFREYRRLMAHWKTVYGPDIYDFDYDTLVRDPVPALERLCGFLGLEWGGREPVAVGSDRAVGTASVWQVREPLYQRASGRARHYARELAPLAAYLAEPQEP